MDLLNLSDDKVKTVKVKGHEFKIRFMTPMDRVKITQRRLALQNGAPVESLTGSDFAFFENIAIVDRCTDEMPKDFPIGESCLNWDDIELINLLSAEIQKHTTDLEERLKKNKPDGRE